MQIRHVGIFIGRGKRAFQQRRGRATDSQRPRPVADRPTVIAGMAGDCGEGTRLIRRRPRVGRFDKHRWRPSVNAVIWRCSTFHTCLDETLLADRLRHPVPNEQDDRGPLDVRDGVLEG